MRNEAPPPPAWPIIVLRRSLLGIGGKIDIQVRRAPPESFGDDDAAESLEREPNNRRIGLQHDKPMVVPAVSCIALLATMTFTVEATLGELQGEGGNVKCHTPLIAKLG